MQRILKPFLTVLILASLINCYTKDLIPIHELKPNCDEDILSAYSKTGKSFTFPKKDGRCNDSTIVGKTESGVIVVLSFDELSAVVVRELDVGFQYVVWYLSIALEVIGIVLVCG